ncbi:MAG: response regulator transcription factor [Prevotella sp.]|nr:response regulator transcription factor [Prevotella sp.]
MTLSCIIVDDEPLAVRLLESYVNKTPSLKLLGSYTDSVEAINALKEQQPDLLFLDIQMPDLNGMELASMVPAHTRVIFTTAFKEYAFESYEVNALDFLLKPIRYSKFMVAVEKAQQWFGRGEEGSQIGTDSQSGTDSQNHATQNSVAPTSLFLRVDGELRQVAIDDILYVSGMKDYVVFYLEGNRKLVTHLTMKAVEDMLPATQFLRVHRSYIVALRKIRSIDRNSCIYIGNEVIRVTDAYKDAFKLFLDENSL